MRIFIILISILLLPQPALASNNSARANDISNYNSLQAALDRYVEATKNGDVEVLKDLYHPDAQSVGFLYGELYYGTPERYLSQFETRPSPRTLGEPIVSAATILQIDGDIAMAVVQYSDYWCSDGTNQLQFARIDDTWKVISFTFWFRPMKSGESALSGEACYGE